MKNSWQKHLNALRWFTLSSVFLLLLAIPFFHLYQTYVAANAYDQLDAYEKAVYHTVNLVSRPFINSAADLDAIKGSTWSGVLFGIPLNDPLAFVSASVQTHSLITTLFLGALIPILLTLVFGRFFCGWICPATFLYELADNVSLMFNRSDRSRLKIRIPRSTRYYILGFGIIISAIVGFSLFSMLYPPAIIAREIFYVIALGGFSLGILFFLLTIVFDLLVTRRGFCRYLCPGGALYSLLGRFRVLRIQRKAEQCNDCEKCNAVCQFHLAPQQDQFGADCNNCTACIQSCPTNALSLTVRLQDRPYQGPGHLGKSGKSVQKKQTNQFNQAAEKSEEEKCAQ